MMNSRGGIHLLFFLAVMTASFACSAQVKQYKARVVGQYPHDETSYTQGLFMVDGARDGA